MKRSQSIRLVLMGSLGTLAGCGSDPSPVSQGRVYTNNTYVPGVGYYHAPFRAWFNLPYNHFEPGTGRYYFGGQWAAGPHRSITNLSEPTPEAARAAELALDQTVQRGGFGRSSFFHGIHS
jgi:hypothetical protein